MPVNFYSDASLFRNYCITFASAKTHEGAIAQLVEQRTENPCVPGSIPGGTTPPFIMPQYFRVERHFFMPKSFNPTKSYPHSSSPYIVHKWREKCG